MTNGITPTYEWAQRHAHIKSEFVRETIAEFFGTLVLLFFVVGAGMQDILHPDSHAVAVFGTVFGLMICIFIFGGVSGAHINPAVSIGLAVAGQLKWAKVPLYIFGQITGGYLGSLLAFVLYKDHLQHLIVNTEVLCQKVANISIPDCDLLLGGTIMGAFSPPGTGTSLGIGLTTEIIITAILLMAVMSVVDKGNMQIPKYMVALLLCLTVAALGMTHTVSGTMLNPVRDMAPRLAARTLGWDRKLCFQNISFEGKVQEWWIVGIFGPPIGAVIGVFLYNFIVGAQLTNNRDDLEMNNNEKIATKSENLDWRNTAFIPRSGQVPPAYNGDPYPPPPPFQSGHYNSGYIGDMKQQQQRKMY